MSAIVPDQRRVFGVVGEPMTGVSYVRFVQPFDHLRPFGYRLQTLGREMAFHPLPGAPGVYGPDPNLLDGISAVIFPQMVTSPTLPSGARVDLVGSLCGQAKRRGIPVVYSVDDRLELIETQNPAYDQIQGSLPNLTTIVEQADAFIVTTEPLREALCARGKPVHLVPNAVDPARWRERPRRGGVPRIGWAGSSSHLDDLLLLVPAIRRLQARVECRLVLLGLTDLPFDEQVLQVKRGRKQGFTPAQRETADRFMALMGELRDVHYEHTPFAATERFFDLLPALDLDIGVCPLVDTPFNRHKSALKFYEYAMAGAMTVASRVTAYESDVSVTVPNETAAWAETLERYLSNAADREIELKRQRAYVLNYRNIECLSHRWLAALNQIVGASCQETIGAAT